MTNSEYQHKILKDLGAIGGTITGTVYSWDGYDDFTGLKVKTSDGTEIVLRIQSDPEGNGPGFLKPEKL